MNARVAAAGSALVVAAVVAVSAQQPAPVAGAAQAGGRGQAPAGRGQSTASPAVQWSTPAAPVSTLAIDTGVQHMVWVVPTRGFTQPWSMAFLPDGGMLVTERPGCLRIVRNGVLDPRHVAGLPPIQAAGLAGLMDIALHPQFAQNQLVYFTYQSQRPPRLCLLSIPPVPAHPFSRTAAARPLPLRRVAAPTLLMRPPPPEARTPRRPRRPRRVEEAEAGKGRLPWHVENGTVRHSSTSRISSPQFPLATPRESRLARTGWST